MAGRTVLDLGTGSGICAVAAALAGAARVVAVDVDRAAEAAVRLNAAANGVAVDYLHADLAAGRMPAADVVLAADLAYEQPLAGHAAARLREARDAGSRVLVADPGRAYFDTRGLERLGAWDVPVPAGLEDRDRKAAAVYALS